MGLYINSLMQKDCRDMQFSADFYFFFFFLIEKLMANINLTMVVLFVKKIILLNSILNPQMKKKIITPFQMSTAWKKNPALEPSFIIILVYFRLLILNKLPISLVIFKILTKFGSKWSSIPRIANFSFFSISETNSFNSII